MLIIIIYINRQPLSNVFYVKCIVLYSAYVTCIIVSMLCDRHVCGAAGAHARLLFLFHNICKSERLSVFFVTMHMHSLARFYS